MNKLLNGQLAYEAYCAHTDWKSLISGAPLPQWDDVKPEIKAAWKTVTQALMNECITNQELFAERSTHQQMVEAFMKGAKQEVPGKPCIPDVDVRRLRAKLILEEAYETIFALGFELKLEFPSMKETFEEYGEPNLAKIIDGCCDLKVVTTGTLSACGVKDNRPQMMVDQNNLEKLAKGTIREDGKLIKPEGHKPPDWDKEIERQSNL